MYKEWNKKTDSFIVREMFLVDEPYVHTEENIVRTVEGRSAWSKIFLKFITIKILTF